MAHRHTKLFGSTSYRTLGCPAHLQRGATVPEPPSSDAAIEGTMLHEFSEMVLKAPEKEPSDFPDWEKFDDDQRNIVETYVGLVREIAAEGGNLYIEQRTESPHLHSEWFGTADAVVVKPPRLTIGDLKCGRVPVNVFEYGSDTEPNPQVGSYAISVLENLKPEVAATIQEVELVIVQPREGGIKRAVFTRRQLDNLKARLLAKAEEAESDNPSAAIGPWCHFCKVKPICPTQKDFIFEEAKLDFALDGGEPTDLEPVDLLSVLNVADAAIEWGKAVKTHAENRLHDNEDIEGWQLVPKRAKRDWTDKRAVESLLLDAGLELEDIIEEALKSPAQIDAILKKKGLRVEGLADLTESVSTGLKIGKITKGYENADGDEDHGWD
jgi:hypothetical protein